MLLTVIMAFAGAQTARAEASLTTHITYNGVAASDVTVTVSYNMKMPSIGTLPMSRTVTDGYYISLEGANKDICVTVTSSKDISTTFSAFYAFEVFGEEMTDPISVTTNGNSCTFTVNNNYPTTLNLTVTSSDNTYTVHYSDGNFIDVSGSMDDQTFTVGVAQKLSPCTFTRSFGGIYYSFAGWATTDGGSAVYSDGQEVTDIAAAGETITLYATWSTNGSGGDDPVNPGGGDDPVNPGGGGDPYSFTVHFDANGGTGTMADQSYSFLNSYNYLPSCTFSRSGYIFAGWNTKADGSGKAYSDVAEVNDLGIPGWTSTLYAQWTALPPNCYGVHFNRNNDNASGTMADQMFTVDEPQALTANGFSRLGRIFAGWNTKANGTGVSYSNGQVVTDIAAEGETITLYAQWQNDAHLSWGRTVHSDANGGTGTMADQASTVGEEINLTANAFTRTGYRFTGWNTKADGSGEAFIDQQNITLAENITLYAQWELEGDLAVNGNTYTINTAAGWGQFCDLLDGGTSFSGKTVKLGNSISVTRMAGSNSHKFTGTFDGGGNTLTVSYENTGDNTMTAPFSYVDGATIQNLIVGGSITGSAYRAAGVIGETGETTSHITSCVSSLTISSGRYTGGFSIGGNVEIEGCVFNGKIKGTSLSGGFVGFSNSKLKIKNCLFAPQSGSSISGGTFYYNGGGNITPENSYYTEALGTAQGTAAYVYTPATAGFVPQNVGAAGTAYDVSGITAYASGLKRGGRFYLVKASVSLADNATNDMAGVSGYVADVTLSGRTLWKDGAWNTLCLPFDVVLEGSPLDGDGVDVRTLDTSGFSGGTLTLNFTPASGEGAVTTMEAGRPYIIKWNATGEHLTESDLVFTGVTISSTAADVSTEWVDFCGTFSPEGIYTADNTKLYLGEGNTLYYPTATDFAVKSCRGYFELKKGLTAGEPKPDNQNLVRAFSLNFCEGSEETGIVSVSKESGSQGVAGAWFSIDGLRLEGKPKARGIYINNGKKVVIK